MILESTTRFLEEHVPPATTKDWASEGLTHNSEYWRQAADMGFTSMLVPEIYGGVAVDEPVASLCIVSQAIGRLVAPGPLTACNLVADAIVRWGSEAQKRAWLPGLTSGECVASWAVAETPDVWHPEGMSTTARISGGDVLVSGTKIAVEAPDVAEVFLVTASGPSGPSQILVPSGSPGIVISAGRSLDLNRQLADVTFSDVRVPTSAILGDVSRDGQSVDASKAVAHQLVLAACLLCGETAAMMDAVLTSTLEYMMDRFAFGRRIASYQALKHRVADHKVRVETALALASALARAIDSADPRAEQLSSIAKAHIGEQSVDVISDCSQLVGGISLTWEHDHHLFLRRATVNRVLYGSPSQHRERLCVMAGI
jgi:alkylation response protein AidB-like acyl-CoA dehydrogenase